MNNEIEKDGNGKLFIIIICLLLFVIVILGISGSIFVYTKEKSNINMISTGNIYLNYTESTNGISITNAYPVNDEVGKNLFDENYYFDFSVNAVIKGNVTAEYEISAIKDDASTLSNNEVRLYLEKKVDNMYEEVMTPSFFTPTSEETNLGSKKGAMILYKDTVSSSLKEDFRLRMWVYSNAVLGKFEKTFKIRVAVVAKIDLDN